MTLPVSTPPNALAYARGEFSTRDLLRISLPFSAVAMLAIILGGEWVMRLCGILR